jgi:cytochrome c oxidase cbb3-type subunit 3
MKKILFVSSMLLVTLVFGQESLEVVPSATNDQNTFLGMPFAIGVGVMILLLFLGIITVLLIGTMIDFGRFSYQDLKKNGIKPTGIVRLFGMFDGDYSYLTSEYQDQVIHEYDGIQEYDNDMPPWWKAGFYITVVFAIAYLMIYHVFGWMPLQTKEYEEEVAEAKTKFASVDQVYEKAISDKAKLKSAADIFQKNCKTCHGASAEGLVGPNLTDEYWLHGGTVNDVYKTIKYGKTEKNMPAWKSNFSNDQVYEIASYILSLQGSKPANAKEPQGEKVVPSIGE